MGQRSLNPLAFTTALPNQLDPALNPVRPAKTGVNNSTAGLGAEDTVRGSRGDQAQVNTLDSAVGGLQTEDTKIDGERTPLLNADLQQQTGQRALGRRLDLFG
jgi:hypothetical protein